MQPKGIVSGDMQPEAIVSGDMQGEVIVSGDIQPASGIPQVPCFR